MLSLTGGTEGAFEIPIYLEDPGSEYENKW